MSSDNSAANPAVNSADNWWKHGVIYQVYPRSYQDSDGDGIGDLEGIRRRIDHLVTLGVDALWLSPIYPSPMADFGYDVADYNDIDPCFGTLSDFDALLGAAKARGLKLILDFVPNHTSDQHPWFIESRKSRDNPKRDWYLWRDPAPGGGPPNNWLSHFGGPAWTLDETTGQYWCHLFLPEQPDLNWRNPAVRAAMLDVLRFWLNRGVDGFRVDVMHLMIKDEGFRDNPPNPAFAEGGPSMHRWLRLHTSDQPEVQTIVADMRRVLEEFSDAESSRLLIGEIYLPIERLVAYYGADDAGLLQGAHLPFNFHLIGAHWQAAAIDKLVRDYEAALPPGAAPNWVLGNHDKSRIASRVGAEAARLAAMLLLTLRGTPTLYYGDELGLTDVPIAPEDVQDPVEKNEPGKGLGRDPERTPMPWSLEAHAGFTTAEAKPWLQIGEANATRAVEAQAEDPRSMLSLHRRLLTLRRRHPALHAGGYVPVVVDGDVLVYQRVLGDERIWVVLNFGASEAVVPEVVFAEQTPLTVLLSTRLDREGRLTAGAVLGAHEGLVVGVGAA